MKDENASVTCKVRIAGFFMNVLGWFLVFIPIIDSLKFLPLIMYWEAVNFILAAIFFAFFFGIFVFLITLAVSWLFFRPLMGVLMFALAGGCVGLMWA